MKPEDEIKRRAELARAQEAERITGSDLWAESYETLAKHLHNKMVNAETPEDTWQARLELRALFDVRRHFERIIQTGRLAEQQLRDANV